MSVRRLILVAVAKEKEKKDITEKFVAGSLHYLVLGKIKLYAFFKRHSENI